MPDWLYDTGNGWVFLLVTVVLGGSVAHFWAVYRYVLPHPG